MTMFNYQIWSKRRFWATLVGVFFLGAMLAAGGSEPQVASEATVMPTPKTVTKQVTVEDTARLKQLAALDEEIFALSAEVIQAQTVGLQTAGNLLGQYPLIPTADIEAGTRILDEQSQKIQDATAKVEALQAKRAELLQ